MRELRATSRRVNANTLLKYVSTRQSKIHHYPRGDMMFLKHCIIQGALDGDRSKHLTRGTSIITIACGLTTLLLKNDTYDRPNVRIPGPRTPKQARCKI